MKLLKKIGAIFDHFIDFLAVLAAFCVAFMMLLMCYEVVVRYFFHTGPAWAVEICEYGLFLLAFLGATWLLREQGHVRVDLAINWLNPKTQSLVNTATSILGAIVCLIIAWYAGESAWSHFERGVNVVKTLETPKAPFLGLISLATFLLAMQFLRQAYYYLRGWRQSRPRVIRGIEATRV